MDLAKLTVKLKESYPNKTTLECAWLARALVSALPETMWTKPVSLHGLATINLHLAGSLLFCPDISEETRKRLEAIVGKAEEIRELPALENETLYHKSVVAFSLPEDLKDSYYDGSLTYGDILAGHLTVFTSPIC